MEGRRVYAGSDTTLLLPTEKLPCSSEILHSFWNFNSSPSLQGDSVSGSTSMFNFENSSGENVFYPLDEEEDGGEDYDRCFHRSTKKRRLRMDQVQFLERSFEVDNKLEPKRKVHLAKELGLQPQQVAIWFQNRRARYKTKQLEKDYDSLKASYDKLKADNDSLLKENEKLEQEVHLIREKRILRERGKEKSPCDPINSLDDAEPQKPIPNTISQDVSNVPMVVCKQEDANSAKSDVFDSESTHYTDGNSSSLIEPANSYHVFEPEQSDFTQDEEDNLSRSFLTPPCFPKVEEGCYDDPDENSCNLGYPIEDQSFWFWP